MNNLVGARCESCEAGVAEWRVSFEPDDEGPLSFTVCGACKPDFIDFDGSFVMEWA